ncbi:lytic transglycosylase domain-containing protein [Albimonas sp. CAU 1670]|uniref:lytic transglycosylase domain-containing protein n=1 Tax=Albimonas sp. CAU 1670 TaxID=3032599 RepID=UPI0023DA747A|nr:lytic transglycosylase domain-containing protein [Albimonas sp. CAU 1670]MDF2233769.1 lytic transglycosylase domain-containing protein [Albimonas sp. CAU 1670]
MRRRFVPLAAALALLATPGPGVADTEVMPRPGDRDAPPAVQETPSPAAAPASSDAPPEAQAPAPGDALLDAAAVAIPPARAEDPPAPPADARCTPDGRSCIRLDSYFDDVCSAIALAAGETGLDTGFLARLLWKESLFDAAAVSPAGAQGIAQFMPGTAKLRGLEDPFNPAEAIFASATYLAELSERYGNPGLAAVAYNGGENRAERFLADKDALLPGETLAYVDAITGHSARAWRDAPPEAVDYRLDGDTAFHDACVEQASTRKVREFADPISPWGVVIATARQRGQAERLAGHMRRAHASLLADKRLQVVRTTVPGRGTMRWYTVQAPAASRTQAMNFCLQLRRSGAICRINRN